MNPLEERDLFKTYLIPLLDTRTHAHLTAVSRRMFRWCQDQKALEVVWQDDSNCARLNAIAVLLTLHYYCESMYLFFDDRQRPLDLRCPYVSARINYRLTNCWLKKLKCLRSTIEYREEQGTVFYPPWSKTNIELEDIAKRVKHHKRPIKFVNRLMRERLMKRVKVL